jgi:hypothetical protein
MAVDLTGGLVVDHEFVFGEQPSDPEIRGLGARPRAG